MVIIFGVYFLPDRTFLGGFTFKMKLAELTVVKSCIYGESYHILKNELERWILRLNFTGSYLVDPQFAIKTL